MFGRDTREFEIQDDAASEKSSLGSLGSAGTSGTSSSLGFTGAAGVVGKEHGSVAEVAEGDGITDLAGSLSVKDSDNLWFKLVEIDPHQKKLAKVVWRQPVLPTGSDYRILVPFFHGFSGNVSVPFLSLLIRRNRMAELIYWRCCGLQSRLFGFRFENDDEARQFYEAVMVRTKARRKRPLYPVYSISF